MSRSRAHIPLKEQLAAALYTAVKWEDLYRWAKGEARNYSSPFEVNFRLPYEDAKQMTADQVRSLFHFDHDPTPHAAGGPDLHWNLTPRLIAAHRTKTKTDVKQLAKVKRLQKRPVAVGLKPDRVAMPAPTAGLKVGMKVTGAFSGRIVGVAPGKRAWPKRKFPTRKKEQAHGRSKTRPRRQ